MFKSVTAALDPDERFSVMVSSDGSPFGIGDLHAWMEPLSLGSEVPERVREQFDKARHAFLYSWFAFDLATLAELQAIASLELALKDKRAASNPGALHKGEGLGRLLELAEKQGWLGPDDIPWVPSQAPGGGKIYYLTMIRNDLAHGSSQLNLIQSVTTIEICCDLIRKLFPTPS